MRAYEILSESPRNLKTIKKNKVALTDEERKKVMDAGATWHHGLNGKPSPAVISLSPNQTDYETGYVEATGAAGINVLVTTDNAAGLILYVRCDDASPQITFSDFLVRSLTAGTLMSSYTAITGTDQALWSVGGTTTDTPVDTDVRVQGLWDYPDDGGITDYKNTVTYTVVDQ